MAKPTPFTQADLESAINQPNPAAEFIQQNYFTEAQLAAALEKHPHTLQNWARLRQGPARCRIGRRICYSRQAVATWLASPQQKPDVYN